MSTSYPGDSVIPDAAMIYDRTRIILAAPSEIFPWIIQLGKNRGGWYLTSFWESLLPSDWRPSRTINPSWQSLAVGDRVADYGFSKDDYFDVVSIDAPHSLVYTSQRLGTVFTWALLLHPVGEGVESTTEVHLRFRGRLKSKGWRRRLIVAGGDFMDWATTSPMLAGLAERVEHKHSS